MKKALLVLDFINDIIHNDGKLAGKGYARFIEENNTINNLNKTIKTFRSKDDMIIFVKVAFSKNYLEQPKGSPLFGNAHKFDVLKIDTWGTQIHESIDFVEDPIIIKHRINAFFGTDLDILLKNNKITDIFVAGCSTDLVVESTVRDGHDKDYTMHVIKDCCAAANEEDHNNSLATMNKIAKITKTENIL